MVSDAFWSCIETEAPELPEHRIQSTLTCMFFFINHYQEDIETLFGLATKNAMEQKKLYLERLETRSKLVYLMFHILNDKQIYLVNVSTLNLCFYPKNEFRNHKKIKIWPQPPKKSPVDVRPNPQWSLRQHRNPLAAGSSPTTRWRHQYSIHLTSGRSTCRPEACRR